jgi:hypothetical protein
MDAFGFSFILIDCEGFQDRFWMEIERIYTVAVPL